MGADGVSLPAFAELQGELPLTSPRAWRFRALAAASRAAANLSEGLRIGYERGFDSGPFMAHVYANEARGRTPLGRMLDRWLLDRGTCRAFRQIRGLARDMVLEAIDAEPGRRPLIADLAAGPAPYLLEALSVRPGATAVLWDIAPEALEQARAEAGRLGVSQRIATRVGSAFDREALSALRPTPDVVIELGLYGIYHDDALIERHLHDLAETAAPRQIVFNVQTQNPEIEYIARVWRDHRGERCVWRLRPLELLLAWARGAGYVPAAVRSDSQGIYRLVRLEREAQEGAA
jgi:SAM-dependent methyltransferase